MNRTPFMIRRDLVDISIMPRRDRFDYSREACAVPNEVKDIARVRVFDEKYADCHFFIFVSTPWMKDIMLRLLFHQGEFTMRGARGQSNLDGEISQIIKVGVYANCGVRKLAEAMGDKYATVWAVLNRNVGSRIFRLLACYVTITGDRRPLRHLARSCGYDLHPLIKLAVNNGQGDLFREANPFLVDPGHIIESRAERIKRDVDDIIAAKGMMA